MRARTIRHASTLAAFLLVTLLAAVPSSVISAGQSQQQDAELNRAAHLSAISADSAGSQYKNRHLLRRRDLAAIGDWADPAAFAAKLQPMSGMSINIETSNSPSSNQPQPGSAGATSNEAAVGPPGSGIPLPDGSMLRFEVGTMQPGQPAADSTSIESTSAADSGRQIGKQPSSTPSNSSRESLGTLETGSINGSSNSTPDAAAEATAAAALLPLSVSNMRRAAQSPLIPGVEYYYKTVNGSEDMPLGLPVNRAPGLALTRWVLSAWSISNLSAPAGVVDSTMQRVEQLINNFTRMSPGQVQLTATANVTIPYVFRGIKQWTPAATAAMKSAASAAAGGYDPAYITVLLEQPDFGMTTEEFLDSDPASIKNLFRQKQVVFYPHRRRLHRKLLQQRSPAPESDSSINSSPAPWGAETSIRLGRSSNASEWTHVWVSYHKLDPLNVTVLLTSLSAACGGVDLLRGADITATPCGEYTRQLMQQSGVQVNEDKYVQYLKNKPMVSVSVRLAVGVTQQQADANTDTLVAIWLAQPRNIAGAINMSGLPDPVGPDALIKWVVPPEIWGAQILPDPIIPPAPATLSAGAIAGITIGCAAFAALVAGLVVFMIDRHKKQQMLEDKADNASSTSSRRRRRRRNAKPRYLLPDLPPPPDQAESSAAAAAAGSSSNAADPAAVDDDLDPEQIRPSMKELGDSVTSAARFEIEDDDSDAAAAAAAAAEQGNAATAAAPAATGAGQPGSIQQRVLTARQALIAEYGQQEQQQQHEGLAPAGSRPVNDTTADAQQGPDLVSRRGGWVPGAAAAAVQPQQQQQQQQRYKLWTPFANDVNNDLHIKDQQASLQSSNTSMGIELQPYITAAGGPATQARGDLVSTPTSTDATADNGVGIAQQQEPATPPRPSPRSFALRSLQPSPDQDLTASSSEASPTAADTTRKQGSVVSVPSELRSSESSSVASYGVLSSRVSKSPFVSSYDFSKLAAAVPDIDEVGQEQQGHGHVVGSHEFGSSSGSHPQFGGSALQGLQGIGSTQISVAGDGSVSVVDQ